MRTVHVADAANVQQAHLLSLRFYNNDMFYTEAEVCVCVCVCVCMLVFVCFCVLLGTLFLNCNIPVLISPTDAAP
jgi:hypothetical protein